MQVSFSTERNLGAQEFGNLYRNLAIPCILFVRIVVSVTDAICFSSQYAAWVTDLFVSRFEQICEILG